MDCLCFFADTVNMPFCLKKTTKNRQQQYNSSINVNKTSDNKGFKLRTPTCTLPTYLHIFGKRELKPDHEIEKSILYFNCHFLLLPQPFQFLIYFTESIM